MYRKVGLIVLFILILSLGIVVTPVHAGGADCSVTPTAGPPGTVFDFFCEGFSANTIVNIYVVEPDHRAVTAGNYDGFKSETGSSSAKTNKDGSAVFSWASAGGGEEEFAHQLGAYVWVVHELGVGNSVVAEGQAVVTLTSKEESQSGASLIGTTTDGVSYWVTGSGFAAGELVNVWITFPADCSGTYNADPALAIDASGLQGFIDDVHAPNSVKADKDGNIGFPVYFGQIACRGFYKVTAHALGSGIGAIAEIEAKGGLVPVSGEYTLVVTPNSVSAAAPFITLLGSGFNAGEGINCWTTRPDGRVFGVANGKADGSGSFALIAHASAGDSYLPFASEEPGLWHATCGTPREAEAAITTFTVYSLTSDP